MLPTKRLLTFTLTFVIVASLAFSATAGAKTIKGTPGNDVLVGTKKADRIDGKAGNDKISGKAGNDVLKGGSGKDKISGGAGDDKIKAKDGKKDTITCGPGNDSVSADAIDKVAADCEVPPTAGTPTPGTTTATITLVVSGGGVVTSAPAGINCGSICAGAFNIGTVVTLTATPNANQSFTGWGGACSGTGPCVVTADAAKGVTASFAQITYPVDAAIDGTGSGSVSSAPSGINCPSDCGEPVNAGDSITLTASPSVGSTFTGWSGGGCSGTGTCVVTPSAATNVTATFTLAAYDLTVSKAGAGTGSVTSSPAGINCGVDCTEPYDFGTPVTLTAASAGYGYIFTGWSGGGCSGTGTCVVTLSAATNVTATFALAPYDLTVSNAGNGTGSVTSSPAGINCGVDCTEPYDFGTPVTLTAAPSVGSTFAGWSGGGCSGPGTCEVTIGAATNVTATFTLESHTLTTFKMGNGGGLVTSSPAGINCGGTCSAPYNHGTMVTLTAAPNISSDFTGWSGGGCSGTGSCVVTMTAAASVGATFTLKTYTLTTTLAGAGTGSVTSSPVGINCGVICSAPFNTGTVVTLTPTSDPGSTFVGWSGGGCSGTGTCNVTMSSATSVTASFSSP